MLRLSHNLILINLFKPSAVFQNITDKNVTFVLQTNFKEHERILTDRTTVCYGERKRKAGFAN